MVESRWLRWIGPGVVALGAVGLIASTTLGAGTGPWVPRACAGPPGDAIAAAARAGTGRARGHARRGRGSGWTRSSTERGRCAASGSRRASAATGPRRRSTCRARVVRRRTVRRGSSSSAPTTARRRACRPSTSRAAAPGRSATERDVIRRATIDPAGTIDLRDARRSRDAAPTSGSGGARSTAAPASTRSSTACRPTPASGARSRPSSRGLPTGDRLAVQSCGEVACRTRIVARDGWSDRRRSTRPTSASSSGSTATGRDLRRLPRSPLPDRLDRPADRRPRVTLDASGGQAVVAATSDGRPARPRGSARRRVGTLRSRRRSTARQHLDLGPIPDGLGLRSARGAGCRDPPARGLGPARPRRPAPADAHGRPPAAPPHPGRHDRPAR